MNKDNIMVTIKNLLDSMPSHVSVEAAAKTRSVEEVTAAIHAGISILGYNYVQEAESIKAQINADVRWHMIGHLQKNKVKKAVKIFDVIETLDSVELALLLERECEKINKRIDVFVEINSGEEARKTGVAPQKVESLVKSVHELRHVRIKGLMTMGPWTDDPEELRPYFRQTKEIFDVLRTSKISNIEMKYLSMGMSSSYKVAIEEGANIVRLGTVLFGPRFCQQ